MYVSCKGAPACDHERDACAASRGERCIECGHGSAAILSYTYTLGPRRAGFYQAPLGLVLHLHGKCDTLWQEEQRPHQRP
jgi:hypothetical protein